MPHAKPEIVSLAEFADLPSDAADATLKRARHFQDLASFGSLTTSGQRRTTAVQCRKRPARKQCEGLLGVRRRDVPVMIDWNCPTCGASGGISDWAGTDADLRRVATRDRAADSTEVSVTAKEHLELRIHVRGHPEWAGAVYDTTINEEGSNEEDSNEEDIVLRLTMAERARLRDELLIAALGCPTERRIDVLCGIRDVLVEPSVAEPLQDFESLLGSGPFMEMMQSLDPGFLAEMDSGLLDTEPGPPQRQQRARPLKRKATTETLQIKVSLRGIKPPIWRRLEVPSDIELDDLHEVIQVAMGWFNCHLHAFRAGQESYAPASPDFDACEEDSAGVQLRDLADSKGERLIYEYDFGDDWTHDILIEKKTSVRCKAITCIKGKRACPPEDCGGSWGYQHLLEVLSNPNHEEHADIMEWTDGQLDPETFDLESVNARLKRMHP